MSGIPVVIFKKMKNLCYTCTSTFCFLLVVLWKISAIYICHFDNLDVFFVSFQNWERVHSSEKQRKWRSDRTKGKVQFVCCFMVTLINELSAKKLLNWVSCNLILLLVKRFPEMEILVIIFCNFKKTLHMAKKTPENWQK